MPIGVPTSQPTGRNIRPVGSPLDDVVAALDAVTIGVVHDTGVNVHLAALDGWWDTPPSTGAVEQRAASHGGWANEAFYTARTITLVARLRGESWTHVGPVLEELQGALPVNDFADLVVHELESGRILTAKVRQDGDPLVARSGAGADLSLSLVAPDPRRYSPDPITLTTHQPAVSGGLVLPATLTTQVGATVVAGTIVAVNEGTVDTDPVLSVAGPCSPFTLTHAGTGRTLRYHESIPAGRTLVIDTAARTARLDGTAPRYVTGSWFTYAPGRNEVRWSADTADAAALLTSTHRNAWK